MKSLARSLSLRSPCETERSPGHPLSGHFENLRNVATVDEIAVIASPALLALPSESLPALLDTALIGRLGPVELGAASAFKLVSKMFNVPLLNVTASFVAEDACTMEL